MATREFPLGTILVADDNDSLRELLMHILRVQGYRVLVAADGAEALKILLREQVDLALIDVMMPGQSGLAVCRAVKERPETRLTPIVLVTGADSTEARVEGIKAGADDFLSKPLRKEELLARVKSLILLKRYTDELENAETVLCSLARSIEAKDPYTEGHCDRLSRAAVALGERLGLAADTRTALRRAGIVHDIGKVVVPEQILLKPGPLDATERRLMESHTIVGERICAPLKSFRHVLPIIRHHHEHLDGSGYPDHLKGDQIPLSARVLTTVDIYDALTTDRPYRRALSSAEAFATIREETERGWWDASLISVLKELVVAKEAGQPHAAAAVAPDASSLCA
ncbi:MAG: HD-GYP domain-containing protein [Candidatus Acidiferrales bacterium]